MSVAIKSLIAFGSLGSIAGAGLAINHFYGGETIKNHLTNSKDYKNRVFLSSISEGLDEILNAYNSSQRSKPKNQSGQNLDKNGLVRWCNDAINNKYYGDKDENFKIVISWCYINIRSFEQELIGSGRVKISQTDPNHQEWQTAWADYSAQKENSGLKITEHTQSSVLNGNQAVQGQTALKTWCDEKASLKMYSDRAEEDFARFKKWCTK